MAMKTYKYAYDNEKLDWLLNFALSVVVSDDLERFDWPGRNLMLETLFTERGVGHEICIEFDFLPHGKGLPVDFVVVSYRDCEPGDEEAALYTYDEFAQGLYAELMKQSESDPERREKANKLIQKFELEKYENS